MLSEPVDNPAPRSTSWLDPRLPPPAPPGVEHTLVVLVAAWDRRPPQALAAAVRSVVACERPSWLRVVVHVQVDGDDPLPFADALVDLRSECAAAGVWLQLGAVGEQWGPAGARNVALSYLPGDWWLAVMDDDDVLPAGDCLSRRVLGAASVDDPHGWSAGTLLLAADDGDDPWRIMVPTGPVTPDDVRALLAAEPRADLPLHQTVTARVASWHRIGGWAGLMCQEDDVALAALFCQGPGLVFDAPVYRYQRGPDGEGSRRDPAQRARLSLMKARWRLARAGLPAERTLQP